LSTKREFEQSNAKGESLLPKKRCALALSLKEPDRVPIANYGLEFAAIDAGFKIGEVAVSSQKIVHSTIQFLTKYDFDMQLNLSIDPFNIEAEGMGSKVKFPENSMPVITNYAVKDYKDIDSLKIPDPRKAERMPVILEAHELFLENYGDKYSVAGLFTSPFSLAIGLRGYTNLIKDMKTKPDYVHKLLEVATEAVLEYGRAFREIGLQTVTILEQFASPPNLSTKQFDEFVLPYVSRVIQGLKPMSTTLGGVWGYSFLQNNWKDLLRKIVASGSASTMFLDPDGEYIDIKEFKRISKFHGRSTFSGISANLIRDGPRELLRERISKHCKNCGPGGGYAIFALYLPPGTPPENVSAFASFVKEFGTYPLST
jgi:uroporphyrinogen decarboxylase